MMILYTYSFITILKEMAGNTQKSKYTDKVRKHCSKLYMYITFVNVNKVKVLHTVIIVS